MSYKVNDSTRVAIFIEGRELPLDAGNALHTLHIVSGPQLTLPLLTFSFTDLLRVVPNLDLQDGSQITVTIIGINTVTRYFRVYKWNRAPSGDGFAYKVEAYWDSVKFWSGTTMAPIRGSSSFALEQIAATCGLKMWGKNTPTADSMLWMPSNKTFGQFARSIARHGYSNDKSHMILSVDSTGNMRYVDINANPKPTLAVGYTSSNNHGRFQVLSDFQPSTNSGINNQIAGYRHERISQTAKGGAFTIESEIQLDPDSKFPLVNEKVRTTQERGTVSFGPINFGNVHDRYERARYQNIRFGLLNSVTADFLFPYQTDLETADNFLYVSPSELGNKDYDGEFTVTTKVVYISGSSYQEKIVAVKNGLEH